MTYVANLPVLSKAKLNPEEVPTETWVQHEDPNSGM